MSFFFAGWAMLIFLGFMKFVLRRCEEIQGDLDILEALGPSSSSPRLPAWSVKWFLKASKKPLQCQTQSDLVIKLPCESRIQMSSVVFSYWHFLFPKIWIRKCGLDIKISRLLPKIWQFNCGFFLLVFFCFPKIWSSRFKCGFFLLVFFVFPRFEHALVVFFYCLQVFSVCPKILKCNSGCPYY